MAKEEQKDQLIKVLHIKRKNGWFCFEEFEISEKVFEKNAKLVDECDPDILPIFMSKMERKIREIFGI